MRQIRGGVGDVNVTGVSEEGRFPLSLRFGVEADLRLKVNVNVLIPGYRARLP